MTRKKPRILGKILYLLDQFSPAVNILTDFTEKFLGSPPSGLGRTEGHPALKTFYHYHHHHQHHCQHNHHYHHPNHHHNHRDLHEKYGGVEGAPGRWSTPFRMKVKDIAMMIIIMMMMMMLMLKGSTISQSSGFFVPL